MGNTTTLGNKSKFRELLDSFGLPRLIIACFLLLLLIAARLRGGWISPHRSPISSPVSAGTP